MTAAAPPGVPEPAARGASEGLIPMLAAGDGRAARDLGILAWTDTELTLRHGLDYDEYARVGRLLARAQASVPWALGDWLLYGEAAFADDKYLQAAAETGLEPQTLRVYFSVARRFPPARRVPELTFAHHRLVASITDDDERERWLRRAAGGGWSVAELRRQIARPVDSNQQSRLSVAEAARVVWTTSVVDGDDYRVPGEVMRHLAQALGVMEERRARADGEWEPVAVPRRLLTQLRGGVRYPDPDENRALFNFPDPVWVLPEINLLPLLQAVFPDISEEQLAASNRRKTTTPPEAFSLLDAARRGP